MTIARNERKYYSAAAGAARQGYLFLLSLWRILYLLYFIIPTLENPPLAISCRCLHTYVLTEATIYGCYGSAVKRVALAKGPSEVRSHRNSSSSSYLPVVSSWVTTCLIPFRGCLAGAGNNIITIIRLGVNSVIPVYYINIVHTYYGIFLFNYCTYSRCRIAYIF